MKIGFLTGCLGDIPLYEKAKFARSAGFQTLEISAWPKENTRDYSGSDIDFETFDAQEAQKIRTYLDDMGLEISAMAYYDNNLDCDPVHRKQINDHLKKVILAAEMLGTELVGTFIGRDTTKDLEGNFDEFEKVFTPLVQFAEDHGVKLMIENCHMPGWLEPGKPGTISYTPELWREMFRRVPSKNFGLNYDPSHLRAMLIDDLEALKGFEDRVFHLHAKDVEVFPEKLKYYGIYDQQLGNGDSYWRYRMPSLGQVNWARLVGHLKAHGYDSFISIEHEDPLYEGSVEKVQEGLNIGLRYLREIM